MLAGVDLDTCRRADKSFEPWAQAIIERIETYAEISPSGNGAKLFSRVRVADFEAIKGLLNTAKTGRQFKKHGGGDHPPGFEIYFLNRYFAVTEQHLEGTPSEIRTVEIADLRWLLEVAGPALTSKKDQTKNSNRHDNSRSGNVFRIAIKLQRAGKGFDDFIKAVAIDPKTASWYNEKGTAYNDRELHRAWENAGAAVSNEDWHAKLIVDKYGTPRALEHNAMIAMRHHADMMGVFGLDEFRQRPTLMRAPPWARPTDKFPRPVNDADLSDLLAWLQQQGIHLHGRGPVRMALASVVQDRTFHPVRDYLDNLVWDEKPRLDKWLTYYLGVVPIENYTTHVGRWWMISAVARIYKPGCTAKYVLVIEGNQDLGKSTALRILGGDGFTDDIATLGTKDSQMQVGNGWIIELAELDSIRRADISAIKAFISRRVDRFRPPYGEHVIEQQRQCVLAATVNPAGEYLHDETGAVRFWPVLAIKIDLSALEHDCDQLWAEAVYRYKAGERWWPEESDNFQPTDEQDRRSETIESDAWFTEINRWLITESPPHTTAEVLHGAFEMPKDRIDKGAERRCGKILRALGFEPRTTREAGVPGRMWHRCNGYCCNGCEGRKARYFKDV